MRLVLKRPLSTEKSIKMMEAENRLVFIVERRAKKKEIAEAFTEMFNIRPVKINTAVTPAGEKKAYVKLPRDKPAIDVATQLGLM